MFMYVYTYQMLDVGIIYTVLCNNVNTGTQTVYRCRYIQPKSDACMQYTTANLDPPSSV